ncbi:MAG: DUF58 domain-containing protein [Pirellulales bacterium]|nr:DUF58 domain-containing protein [Pirellulales bacterium]
MSLASSIAKSFRTTICREAWYYLAVLAVIAGAAMFREINLLLVLAGMIAGPLWLSWREVAANLRGLRVSRRMPQSICAGDLLVVHLELVNTRRRGSWAVAVEEPIRRAGRATLQPGVFFSYVGPGQANERSYHGRLTERGRYEIGPVRLSTRFPFGLLKRTTTVGQSESVVVFPRLGRLTQAWLARHHEAFEGDQRHQQRSGRVEGQFYGTRYWRNGDSRRSIDWRSSARRDRLVVRQYEQPHNRDVALVVELWQPVEPSKDDQDRVGLAVSFAATVIADVCRKGDARLSLATTAAPDEPIAGPASTAIMHDCMRQLAVAEADDDDRLPRLLESALDQMGSGHEIIVISTRDVDLDDAGRFGRLRQEASRAAALRRVRVISTSGPTLARYFQVE